MCDVNYFPEKSPLKRLPANPATAELPEGFLPLPGFELVDVLVAPKSPPSKEVRFELPISPPSNEPIAFAEEPEVCCPNRLMKSGATAERTDFVVDSLVLDSLAIALVAEAVSR